MTCGDAERPEAFAWNVPAKNGLSVVKCSYKLGGYFL
jgi:hypothetical protein